MSSRAWAYQLSLFTELGWTSAIGSRNDRPLPRSTGSLPITSATTVRPHGLTANFGVSDRRFRFKPAGGFGGNRQAVSVQSGTPLRMGFGPDFGEPPLRDTSYLALACPSKYSCHHFRFIVIVVVGCELC